MSRTSNDPEIEDFKEHIEALMELSEEKECVYTMEFLSIALECFQAERKEYLKRQSNAEKPGGFLQRSSPIC